MKRHSHSLGISLLLHTLFVAILLVSSTSLFQSQEKKQDTQKKIAIHLNRLQTEHPVKKSKPKTEKKKEKKKKLEKKKTIKKKTIKKKIIKKRAPKKRKKQVPKKIEKIEKTEEIKEVVQTEETPPLTTSKQEPKQESSEALQKHYIDENLAKIVTLLQENLYYPRRARKRGIEGEVVVRFKLSKDAKVSQIEILSSESDILSRGARRTIEDLSEAFPEPKESLLLTLPISYRLQ